MTERPPSGGPEPGIAGTTGPRRVVVIGAGMIGTSVALALRERGADVWLADRDAASARLAADIGAGTLLPGAGGTLSPGAGGTLSPGAGGTLLPGAGGTLSPGAGGTLSPGAGGAVPPENWRPWDGNPEGPADLALLAVPPAAVAPVLAEAQARNLARWYTDVASVKGFPLAQARVLGCDLASFVAGHPLSGRERSGPAAARADLFLGRPWVICPAEENPGEAVAAVVALARACGAEPVLVDAAQHDRWVALVSHAPHVVSAAMAAQLADSSDGALALAGQGLRDVTRIAAGDSALWTQILAANAAPVAEVLAAIAADLAAVAEALAEGAPPGRSPGQPLGQPAGPSPAGLGDPSAALKILAALLDQGCAGVTRIPGKRGTPARAEAVVQVVIPDLPGELARLFEAAGNAGVNIEDIGIEHSPGLPVGVAELTVHPEAVAPLTEALAANGWPVRG